MLGGRARSLAPAVRCVGSATREAGRSDSLGGLSRAGLLSRLRFPVLSEAAGRRTRRSDGSRVWEDMRCAMRELA